MEAFSELLEGEEHVLDGDVGILVDVEEEHGVSSERLHHTDEEVALSVDGLVDQVVGLGFLGSSESKSNSSFSKMRVRQQTKSVKQQMMIMRNELRGRGTPKKTLRMTGQSSDHEPAGSKYEMTFCKFWNTRRPSLIP